MTLHKAGKILLLSGAGAIGFVALAMLALKLALDRAPQYQDQIKDWVQAQIGYHIGFAHVSPAFRWYGPELYFDRLELRSKDGARVLARAAGGRVGADIWQLVRTGRLLAGRVELDSPRIVITRTGPERFSLASEIELGGGDAALASLSLDQVPTGTLAIRHGIVTIERWNDALPQLELRDVNLNIRHGDARATLVLTAILPAVLGGDVTANGALQGRGPLPALGWTLSARTRHLSLAGWHELLPEFLQRLGSGAGGFELSARGQGLGLARADLEFGATAVMARLTNEPGVTFDEVAGTMALTHAGDRWTLAGRRVRAQRGGRRDPESEFDVNWRDAEGGLLELHARASYLRAETLLPLAGLVPQKDLRQRLQEAAPTGEWTNMGVDLSRATPQDRWGFRVLARFRGVGFAPMGRAPGLRGLDGSIAGTEQGGRLDIDTPGAVFTWPLQLAHPIDVQTFKTTMFWRSTADELLMATPAMEIRTRDAVLRARVAWHQPMDEGSPVLVLAAGIDDGNVAAASRYFPRALLAPPVLEWLDRAFVAGHLSHADVAFQGPVRNFPFRDGSGAFLARLRMEGVSLDYREGWPRADDLGGVAEFRDEGLAVLLQRGHLGGFKLEGGTARFVDFKTAELNLHTVASGDAAEAVRLLRSTPLDAMSDHGFAGVDAAGPLQADVDLFMPFRDFEHRRIAVHTTLHGVSVGRVGAAPIATELIGEADIDGARVARADVHGRLLGGAFQVQARAPRTSPTLRTMLVFNGVFSGDALRSALSLPAGARVAGVADWHAVLRVAPEPERERSLRINSSLTGLEMNLPEPLAKPAGRPLPTLVDVQWPTSGQPQVRFTLGSVLRGQLNLDAGANGPQLGRAAVTFGASSEPAALSESQVLNAGGQIERLDLSGWLKLFPPDGTARPLSAFLRSARFEVDQVDYLGLAFRNVALELAAADAGLRIGVGGPNVSGSITLPGAADPSAPWKLEFERLHVTGALQRTGGVGDRDGDGTADGAPERPRESPLSPRSVPAVNFHAADLIWDDREFGDVRATLVRVDDGVALKDLEMSAGSFRASASGDWRAREGGIARVAGTVSSTDVGSALKKLGYADVIEAKSGRLTFDLHWAGEPTEEALSGADGHVQIALDKGQITGLKPGAGRMVGLASVAALPRRLTLDFSDLTDKGLAFDTVRGDFDLRGGNAFTDNVLVKGPAAEIGLIGRVGLKNKDYDQTAVVTGNVGSSLPLAAFVAGPVVGGAVLLFTQVFKQPLKGLARGYYHISGSWDNPTVERIKSADAAAAAAEAPK